MIAPEKQAFIVERSVNCNVHGSIDIIAPLSKIIDMPQFQRLRYIKQLGICHFVYPTSIHTRFEHSLGVYHLAFTFTTKLQSRYPSLISNKDVLCISIAALIHDLGHGAFSHTYDNHFLPSVRPGTDWKHEKGSVLMWNFMLDSDGQRLRKLLTEQYDFEPLDFTFIEECIKPPKNLDENIKKLVGRPKTKHFQYSFVSNPFGLDVDRMDYMLRDSICSVIPITFSAEMIKRIFNNCQLQIVDGAARLTYNNKVAGEYHQAAICRIRLHDTLYGHKTAHALERLLVEILELADPYLKFVGTGGKLYTLSGAIDDMEAFSKVNDDLLIYIKNSYCDELAPARQKLNDLEHRRLYRRIGFLQCKESERAADAKRRIDEYFVGKLRPDEYFIVRSEVHQGLGLNEHPISKLYVYTSDRADEAPETLTESQTNIRIVSNYVNLSVFLHSYDKPESIAKPFEEFMKSNFGDNQPEVARSKL